MDDLTVEQLAELQAAREAALEVHADDGCEVCQSDWFRSIDYTKMEFKAPTDEERLELARFFWDGFSPEERVQYKLTNPYRNDK